MTLENQEVSRTFATIGWGALFVWWGTSILVGPITIGLSAVGTGLILLGVNAARWLQGIPINRSNTPLAAVAIVWGALDHLLHLSFGASTATLLIVVGIAVMASIVTHPKTA